MKSNIFKVILWSGLITNSFGVFYTFIQIHNYGAITYYEPNLYILYTELSLAFILFAATIRTAIIELFVK